jgi:uncharacterized membrane protein HdeD (DUF308 family)
LSFEVLYDKRRKTMDEKTTMKFVPKKHLTKVQAITVMAIGGLMLLLSIVIPTAPDSTAHTVKVIVGVLGMCVGIVGVCYRPMEAPKNPKE